MQYIPCDVRLTALTASNLHCISSTSPSHASSSFSSTCAHLRSRAVQVSTVCFGTAASMGAFLLCTGAKGASSSSSSLMRVMRAKFVSADAGGAHRQEEVAPQLAHHDPPAPWWRSGTGELEPIFEGAWV
eukprot:1165895-Rhodomonas_salina.3